MPRNSLALGMIAGALLTSVAASHGGQAPDRIQLIAFGTHTLRDGRGPFILADRAQAEKVVAATKDHLGKTEMMVDYDHQSVFGVKDGVGGQAKAAGWIKSLSVEDDGIWATVEWTEAAAASIQAREYRYLSPYFSFDKKSGRVTRINNVGLVNVPAFDLEALAASLSTTEENEMSLKKIAAALGLADDADEAAVLAAIETGKTTMSSVAAALKVEEGGDIAAAATAAVTAAASAKNAGDPDPTQFVPKAAFDELQSTVASLQDDKLQGEVDAAVAAGKLAPAMKDWGLALIKKDPTAFASFVESAPVLAGGKAPVGKTPDGKPALDDEDRAVCALLGVDEAAYSETLQKEAV